MIPAADFNTGYHAIRNSVALEEESEMRCLMLRGKDAFKVLDAICPCDVYLQNGQLKHTFLLDKDGIPFADVYIARNWENAYLLGYGPQSEYLIEWIKKHACGFNDYQITDIIRKYTPLTINGPYAWELCAEVAGSFILGLPYLAMTSSDNILVFRAGVTGEFGYHLLIPNEQIKRWLNFFLEKGKSFDLIISDKNVREQCTLENFFFNINQEGRNNLNPMELQLQWRISWQKKSYPGYESLMKIRNNGWTRRLCAFKASESIEENRDIFYQNEIVGKILTIGYSPRRKEYIGKALIQKPYWLAGLDIFHVDKKQISTLSAPTIDNLSLKVNPYLSSYFTKDTSAE